MNARLVYRSRSIYKKGFIEAVVWQVPYPVPPSEHPYKYRLVYIVEGQRVVGYDNERGKGDHRHIDGTELRYQFIGPEKLMVDFLTDVDEAGNE